MNLKKAFLFIVTLLLTVSNAFAQGKDAPYGDIVSSKLVWHAFEVSEKSDNRELLSMHDSAGNIGNFNKVLSKALRTHTIHAYHIYPKMADTSNIREHSNTGVSYTYYRDIDTGSLSDSALQLFCDKVDFDTSLAQHYFLIQQQDVLSKKGHFQFTIRWLGIFNSDSDTKKPVFVIPIGALKPLLKKYIVKHDGLDYLSFNCYDILMTDRYRCITMSDR